MVLQEDHGGVSRKHAAIFFRHGDAGSNAPPTFFLEDFSSYGTWVLGVKGWQKVHRQEVPLHSGAQLKFGSSQNEPFEFLIHHSNESHVFTNQP
jgi:pSer/pThr/pTyr-binding forkhead associated (FHA) protein